LESQSCARASSKEVSEWGLLTESSPQATSIKSAVEIKKRDWYKIFIQSNIKFPLQNVFCTNSFTRKKEKKQSFMQLIDERTLKCSFE
jgi:hypothetical protein